ncbi:MAG: tellurium resistance protein TerC [Proteobacteria bacterium]|nr:tellurium resistance protein TerC [Pseudomonadota bacterium]
MNFARAADGSNSLPFCVEGGPPLGFPTNTVAIFIVAFVCSIIVDLIQHRNAEEISFKSSVIWSIFWIVLSLAFYGWVRMEHGKDCGNLFLTGYVLEKTLSVDNLMVFIAVFKYFNIKDVLQHRILYLGILGAIIFRGVFVAAGSLLLHFEGWAELIFGAFVAWAGYMMLGGEDEDEEEPDYEQMWLVDVFRGFYPIFPALVQDRFFISKEEAEKIAQSEQEKNGTTINFKQGALRYMTPAFVCLLVIEGSDVLFAFDSVPAVIAVTHEPLLVFSAMIFAILGLRSLYFVLVALTKYLVHIETAVIFVLFFIAGKMFLHAYEKLQAKTFTNLPEFHLDISPTLSMYIVLGMLSLGVIASFIWPEEDDEEEAA